MIGWIIILLVLAALAFTVFAAATAPVAYQDDSGFHFGHPPASGRGGSRNIEIPDHSTKLAGPKNDSQTNHPKQDRKSPEHGARNMHNLQGGLRSFGDKIVDNINKPGLE